MSAAWLIPSVLALLIASPSALVAQEGGQEPGPYMARHAGQISFSDCSDETYICGYVDGLRFSLPRECSEEALQTGWTGAGVEMRATGNGVRPLTPHSRSGRFFAFESTSPEQGYFILILGGSPGPGLAELEILVPGRREDFGQSGSPAAVKLDGQQVVCRFHQAAGHVDL